MWAFSCAVWANVLRQPGTRQGSVVVVAPACVFRCAFRLKSRENERPQPEAMHTHRPLNQSRELRVWKSGRANLRAGSGMASRLCEPACGVLALSFHGRPWGILDTAAHGSLHLPPWKQAPQMRQQLFGSSWAAEALCRPPQPQRHHTPQALSHHDALSQDFPVVAAASGVGVTHFQCVLLRS